MDERFSESSSHPMIPPEVSMKSACVFRDQVNTVWGYFQTWNDCEQTVALCSLLKKISAPQAKFLSQVLEQSLSTSTDLQQCVDEANDPEYIRNLCNESKEKAVHLLISHLPLLEPRNKDAKSEYLLILPKILAHSIEHGIHIEESRQLLSYALIHPAITGDERAQFTLWLSRLEESFTFSIHQAKFSQNNVQEISQCVQFMDGDQSYALSANGWGDQSGSHDSGIAVSGSESGSMVSLNNFSLKLPNNGASSQNGSGRHRTLHSTLSAPPGLCSTSNHSAENQGNLSGHMALRQTVSNPVPLGSNSNQWLNTPDATSRPRSASHDFTSSLSPQSTSSSSSDLQDENQPQKKITFLDEGSGMRDVPGWLKGLRLHKYSYLFQHLTYEEMLGITEEWLELQNVTKGARNKIIISVKKLRERHEMLETLEKDIVDGGNLKPALTEIKSLLMTPLKMYSQPKTEDDSTPTSSTTTTDSDSIPEADLPGQFTRVLGKVCTQLLVARQLDDDSCSLYLQCLDRCINHEAFTQKQKKLMFTWIQQIQQIWHPSQKFMIERHRKNWGSTFPIGLSVRGSRGPVKYQSCKPGGTPQCQWTFKRASPANVLTAIAPQPLQKNNSLNTYVTRSITETKRQLERTQSAPSTWGNTANLSLPLKSGEFSATEEINARLDSLCLSMTEHALGGLDGMDRGSTF
ncbi:protein Smaug homolog 1-like [Tubulanus polymorphus]|uniref:protein Smaug homolog 1-like n=1 Tax=Tubulanus polymorphus TaxID=672921 RepID=UPI003DA2DD75